MINTSQLLLGINEVTRFLKTPIPIVFKIIQNLSSNLKAQDYMVTDRKANRKCFGSKICGGLL